MGEQSAELATALIAAEVNADGSEMRPKGDCRTAVGDNTKYCFPVVISWVGYLSSDCCCQ